MKNKKPTDSESRSCINQRKITLTAILFIIFGLLWLGKNLGYIETSISRVIFSWQSLLILIGIWQCYHRHLIAGVFCGITGLFFMVSMIEGYGKEWTSMYWPLVFIFSGIVLLIKRKSSRSFGRDRQTMTEQVIYDTENGFVISDNTLGSVRQIVLDPLFKGARIRNVLGGTILDLRKTSLPEGDTIIDVECRFGGIEIRMPDEWNVVQEVAYTLGGCDDKRYGIDTDGSSDQRIILRGKVTFGGIEIKN